MTNYCQKYGAPHVYLGNTVPESWGSPCLLAVVTTQKLTTRSTIPCHTLVIASTIFTVTPLHLCLCGTLALFPRTTLSTTRVVLPATSPTLSSREQALVHSVSETQRSSTNACWTLTSRTSDVTCKTGQINPRTLPPFEPLPSLWAGRLSPASGSCFLTVCPGRFSRRRTQCARSSSRMAKAPGTSPRRHSMS